MTERAEPLVLINLFAMPPDLIDGFIQKWPGNIEKAKGAKGFRGTRLHRAIDPDAQYPVVNIARWDSAEDWRATVSEHFWLPGSPAPEGRFPVAHPALYTVAHDTPDPLAAAGNR
jgi:hypothetical protein